MNDPGNVRNVRNVVYLDRSRLETLENCPRKYWYAYCWGRGMGYVGGLESIRLAPALETGTALHRVRELVLASGMDLDAAIASVLAEYRAKVEREAAEVAPYDQPGEALSRAAEWQEQYDLVEALSRVWFAVALPRLRSEFDVIGAEQEYEVAWQVAWQVGEAEVRFLSRPDLVVRRKSDQTVFVHSLKSTSAADERWREQWRYDQQTLTECHAVEAKMGEVLGGVIVEGLVKGVRREWEQDGVTSRTHANPLVWAWVRDDGITSDWRASYKYTCREPHALYRGTCPGGKVHNLGKDYKKVRVAERYPGGIKAWIEALVASPDAEVVRSLVVQTDPILRSEYELERWKRQTLPRLVELDRHVREINGGPAPEQPPTSQEDLDADTRWRENELDRWFPMATAHGNCTNAFGRKCEFFDLCHGVAAGDPLNAGFRMRKPNHPAEGERK